MEVLLYKFASATKFTLKLNKISEIVVNKRNYCLAAVSEKASLDSPPTPQTAATAQCADLGAEKTPNKQRTQNSLHIAVIGVPNAGKSTFINNLINHRVCPTSSKVHTTRKANKAIYTTGHTQLIFHDTPGLVTPNEIKRHHLEANFKSAYRHAIQQADIIACMHDVSNSWTRNALHPTVIDTLQEYQHLPSFLVLNKIDVLKSKRVLLDLIRKLTNNTISSSQQKWNRKPKIKAETHVEAAITAKSTEKEVSWGNFQEVFLISSITGNGLSDIQNYLTSIAKDRCWDYAKDIFTDEKPEELIVESVRARLLDYLPQEIPYNLHSAIEFYSEENGTIYASVEVTCPSARIERLICGESNGKLRQITERVTSDLVETFGKRISLTIATKARNKE